MRSERSRTMTSRRNMLKALGLASASVVATPVAGRAVGTASTKSSSGLFAAKNVRVGLLIPQSSLFPTPSSSFMAGVRLYLDSVGNSAGGRTIELVSEDIGKGVSKTIGASRRLIENERVDLVTGLFGPAATHWLRDIAADNRTIMIAASAGERVLPSDAASPYIFHNTLGYSRASCAMGAWGARNIGKRCVIATSLYESGYDTLRAFREGFESAGGVVADVLVTGASHDPLTPAAIMPKLRDLAPDVVIALFSPNEAREFVRAYQAAGLAGNVPLIGSAFMTSEHVIGDLGPGALGMTSCFTWAETLPNAENLEFTASYRKITGHRADPFAILGYDTARMIVETLNKTGGETRAETLATALSGIRFKSPRGTISVDRDTRSTTAPLYLREVRRSAGFVANDVITTLDMTNTPLLAGVHAGWMNPYLSV